MRIDFFKVFAAAVCLSGSIYAAETIVIHGDVVHTMNGTPIEKGTVVIVDGKITQVGRADAITAPSGARVLRARAVTPGLIDSRSVVGLAGYLNQDHDQDQIDKSNPSHPELRAIDGYNAQEPLVAWLRNHGVTTIHTGHGPGAILAGQTMIAKTRGANVDEAVVKPFAMVAATLGESALAESGKSPGTRAKQMAMLRQELLKAQDYQRKSKSATDDKKPARDLHLESLVSLLDGTAPLLATANRERDIVSAIRLSKEFGLKLVIDGAAEAYLALDAIKSSGAAVLIHPTMARSFGETENLSMETASKLKAAGIPFAMQGGFESYVPKSRVVLFEAALAAANGLTFDEALSSITIDAARILGIADRVGSLAPGKDGDVALFDGDPFEYTTHVTAVVIDGRVVSETPH